MEPIDFAQHAMENIDFAQLAREHIDFAQNAREHALHAREHIDFTTLKAMYRFCTTCKGISGLGIRSFQKNVPIFAFFSVLYKRTERSLRSFPVFIKERSDLCVLFRSL